MKTDKQQQPNKTAPVVTKDMNIGDIVFKYPDVAEIMMDYGLHCVGCMANGFDTIEQGAKIHQLSDEEIEEMLMRVNDFILYGEE
ncbi:DUF1858 domain-containing protein [Patescibacteria group bacterium]|nr:DUF1858 domain-containing protein [Patescibacteria group bacterium]